MSLDEAIQQMSDKIKSASPGAEIKSVKMSDEEAARTEVAMEGTQPEPAMHVVQAQRLQLG